MPRLNDRLTLPSIEQVLEGKANLGIPRVVFRR